MKNIYILFIILGFPFLNNEIDAQNKQEKQVMFILYNQAKSWNNGNIEAFMQGYWKSDKLQFIGSKGVTYGWENVYNNYKKAYSTPSLMGQLKFDELDVEQQSKKIVTVTGKYILTRSEGEVLSGYFLLVVKKIGGKWKIIRDYST